MFKKTAGTFLAKVITSLINLAIVIVLSRWMGAQGKGEASLIIAGITMLLLFCNMIGGASLVYLAPRYNVFQLAVISNLWSIVICAASYFILSRASIIPERFVVSVCLLALINSFLATNLTILLGKEKIWNYNFILLLQAAINLAVLSVLLRSLGRNDTGIYIISLYIALLSSLIISTFLILPYIKDLSFVGFGKITKQLARFGIINQAGHVMKFASFRISYFLLSTHCGNAGVGIYSNGTSLIESLLLITNSIATVQYPAIANSDDKVYSQQLTIRLTRLSLLLCVAAMIPLLLLPGSFFVWLFGQEFNGVRQVILLLSPGILFYNIALITGHYFSGTGKYKVNTAGNLAGLLITLALSAIFISSYSISIAAIISTVAYIVTTLTILYYFLREAKISFMQLLPVSSDLKWAKEKIMVIMKGGK